MGSIYKRIDPQLRFVGFIVKLLLHPSVWGFRFLHWLLTLSKPRPLKGAETQTHEIPRSQEDSSFRTLVYRPVNIEKPLPIVVYFHGGGYAMQLPDNPGYHLFYKGLMKTRDCIIIAPDYRRSLDAPYPAAFDDCYDTLLWAKQNAKALGGRSDQLFVMGDSAGGGLTLATCLKARNTGDVNVAFQMPLYPMIDDTQSNPSAINNRMPGWNSGHNRVGWKLYLRGLKEKGAEIPETAAPARATSMQGLPPAVTFVGDLDPFLDETVIFVERLKETGVPVEFEVYPGCFHGFDQIVPDADKSKEALRFLMNAYAYAVDNYTAEQPK